MQKPFTLSPEMSQELHEEITALAPTDDTAKYIPRPKNMRKGAVESEVNEQEKTDVEDPINPSHYRKHPSGIECIEVVRHMNFNLGQVFKYIWRADHKGLTIENLKKARWHLDDEIQRLEGKR